MRRAWVWIQGIVFSVLVPGTVAFYVPYSINGGKPLAGGAWQLGWIPLAIGVLLYLSCLANFLAASGTPAIFFTRPVRLILGEEPASLVRAGLYRFSRNPMYLGVTLAIFGQAIVFASAAIARYGVIAIVCFHLVVVLLEEPHLRAKKGAAYDEYCRHVPRWFGRAK